MDEGDSGTTDLVFTVSMDLQSDREVTVEYDVGGTAESGTDYEAPTPARVTFPALSQEVPTMQTITFRVIGDTDAERDETVEVELRDPSGGAALGTARAEGTIRNDDEPVLSVTPSEVDEGDSTADRVQLTFRVTMSGQSNTDVTVDYQVDTGAGTATVGTDYRDKSDTATIESGDTGVVVRVRVIEDTEFELDETVVMVFENPVGAVLDPDSARVTGTILNDDLPPVTVAAVAATVTEGEAAAFRLRRPDLDTSEALVVSFTVADPAGVLSGTAPATATIAAGETEGTVSLDTVDDGDHEAHGSVTLTLAAGADYVLGPEAERSAEVTVRDNDDSPATGSVTVTGTPTEGETLTAEATGIVDADGLDNADYAWQWVRTPSGGGDEDISGATSETYVPVFADAGATLKARLTVTDDEDHEAVFESVATSAVAALPRPVVTVASDGDVTEGDTVTFTLTRTVDTTGTLDVAYAVTASGDFGAATGTGTATFLANSATVQVSVATTGDNTHEAHGSVTLTLTADTSADPAWLLGDPATATAAVEDDDDSPATGTVTVTGTATEGRTLTADTSGLTDADGLDNAAYAWQWVRTPAGGSDTDISGATSQTYVPVFADAGATLKVRVTVTDDEGHEASFTSDPTSAVAALPRVSVVHGGSPITEGENATFTFTLSKTIGDIPLRVNIRRTETGNMMFPRNLGRSVVVFGPNQTTLTVSYPTDDDDTSEPNSTVTVEVLERNYYMPGTPSMASVEVRDDDDSPATGTVTVTGTATEGETLTADTSGLTDEDGLDNASYVYQWVRTPAGGGDADISGATGATYVPVYADAGATLKVKVTVTDDEGHEAEFESAATSAVAARARPSVTVVSDGDVTEGSAAVFTLTRTGDPAQTLDVPYEVTATGDFGAATGAGTATFLAGSPTVQVSVATTGDSAHEAHGSVTLTLTADTSANPAYVLGDPSTATAVVRDDDNAAPTGAPTIDDTTPVVGQTLTADASNLDDPDGLTNRSFTWQWIRVSGGTATRISGATAETYTVVDADMGATLKVEATFTDDDGTEETVESTETATVEAAPLLELSIGDASVDEGDSGSTTLDFTVTLDRAATETVTVDWATSDGTAEAGTDYTAGTGSLTFNSGDSTSKTVSVTVAGDEVDEPNETFTVTLTNPSGATLGDDTAIGTITDDDAPPTVTLVLTPDSITEAAGQSTVTARLDHPSSEATTVTVSVAPESPAVAGDYTLSANLELTVPAGATTSTGTVTITAVDNAVDAPHKTVTVSATATNAQGITAPQDVTLTILDDENVAPTGAPTIDDTTPVVGERLTADTSGIGDSDGLAGAAYAYRWLRVASGGAVTEVGTGQSYTVVDADVGSTLKVEVTFTDEGGAEETIESEATAAAEAAPTTPTIFDADGNYSLITQYGRTTTVDLTAYLAEGVASSVVSFEVDEATDCGATRADYYQSVTVSGSTLSLVPNTLGHTHGSSTESETACVVTGTMGGQSEARTFSFRIPAPRALTQVPVVSVVDRQEDALGVQVRDPSGLGSSWLRLSWRETEKNDWEHRIMSGARLRRAEPPVIRIEGLESGTSYTVQAAVLRREAFDYYANGRTIAERVLTTLEGQGSKWLANMRGGGQSAVGRAEATTTTGEPVFLRASVNGDVLTVTMNEALDGAQVPAASAFTVSGGHTVSGVAVSGSSLTLTLMPFVGADETVTVSYAVPGSGSKLQDDGGNAAPAFTDEAVANETPTVTLVLTPDTIGEDGETSTVTATLDKPSPQATTVTVTAPSSGAGYSLGANRELTIAANALTSTGVVTITAEDNDVDAPNKTVAVSGGAENSQGVSGPDDVTLTITDDDDAPTVTLVLTPASISEDGGVSMVTARLSHPSSEDTTLTVSVAPVSPAVAGDYTLTAVPLLSILAGETESESTNQVRITAVDNDVIAPDKTVTVSARVQNRQGVTAPQNVTLTITDDESAPPLPVLSIADASVDEGDTGSKTLDFTVTLDRAATETVTVEWATSDGTATAGTDYTAGNGTLTFSSGDSSKTVSVTVAGDNVDEPNETFTVTLTNPSGATLGDDTATGTITDDDDAPTVTLVLTPDTITESGGVSMSTVTATLNHPSSEATTVTVTAAPESPAVAGDYTLSGSQLTIPAGATASTGTVTITAVDNAVHAPDKTVTVSATATNAQGITTPQDVTLTILDDDNAAPTGEPTIDDTTPVVGETLTADASGIDDPDGLTDEIDLQWLRVASGGTATEITGATSETYTVVAADVGATLKVEASFTDDGGTEETVGSKETATVEAAPPLPVLSIADASVDEGDTGSKTLGFTVTLDRAATETVTVEWATSDGTATAGTDYTAGNGTLTFSSGDSSKTVSVTVAGDNVDEPNETFTVTLTNPSGATLGDDTATGTITDDDATPTVTLVLTPASITEEASGQSTVTARLDHPSSEETTVTVSVAPVSPAVAGDYTLSGSQLTIPAGATDSTGTVTITAVDNAVHEGDKTVTVSGTATNTLGITAPQNVTLTITDDEAPPTPTTIFDADGNYSLITQYGRTTTVNLAEYLATGVASSAVSFEVDEATDCGATRADYYESVTVSGSTLSLVPNNLGHTHGSSTESETACVVTGTMGGQSEARTFSFQIPAPRRLTQVPVVSVVDRQEDALGVQVRDPSGLGSSWLRLSWRETEKNDWEHRIMSGARLRRAEPPVIRIEGLESGTSYTVQAAVLRREAFDYYANGRTIAERVLTTLEGQGSKWLANMRGGGQSAVGRAEATTTMGEPVFLRASVNGDVLTVTMNEALDGAQVPAASAFTVSGGHTVSGVAVSGSSLTLTLMPFVGADETVTVSYAVPGSGSKLQDDGGNAAPAFTDEAVANETPTVTLVLTPDTIGEDGETSTVTATLDKPSPQATTVTVTAPSSGAGYSLGANRELTIAANALTSTGVVTITAEDNDVDAPNKTVAVSGGAENSQGVSGPDDVTLTITDDDDAPTVTLVLTPASISEDGGVSMVTARLSHPSSEDTTLTVSVAPVSPAVAGDYTLTAVPLLSILAGETESESTNQVRITAVDNDVIAPDKTVTVSARVQNRQGVTAPQNVTLTITDDESAPPLPVLSIADASVDEGDTGSTTLDFTVTLDRAATETVTVEWATSDGTATAGTDYTAGNGTLTFSSGDSSKTVSVTVAGDNVDEPNETFEVTLTNPSGATLGDDTATGTITDDDATPTVTLVLTPDTITESGGVSMSTVTATLNHPSSEATTVTVTAAPESPAVAGDYTLSGSQLTIPAGATASTGTVTITAVDNAVHAPDKTVTVSATATNAQGITTPQDVTLTILDDDNAAPTGEPTIDDTTPVVGETLTADASGIDDPDGLTDEIDLQWLRVASGGTATEITGATSETYTVVAADVGATLKVEASFTDDGGTEETVGSKETATVEAAPPLPVLSIADASVDEGDTGSKTLGFTVTLDRAATETVTVEWATSDGTATAGTDYTAGNGTLTFSSGDSSKTVSVTVAGDNVDEPNETFEVTLTNPSGATLGDDTATGTITDDDATPTVTLVLTPASITEEASGQSTVTARLDHPSSEETTVTVSVAPVSPAVAGDYTLSGSQLTIPAGATDSTGTVTITAVDNAVHEGDKTVTVSGTATNTLGITAPQNVTLTITDDEAPPTPTTIFDADGNYSLITQYGRTTTVNLAEYLATGVASSAVSFEVDEATDCGATRADYYESVTVSGSTLSLVPNNLGHTHGSSTESETACVVTGTMGGQSEARTFSFQIPAPRRLTQVPVVSVVDRQEDALGVQVRDPSGLGSSWLRLSWRETEKNDWEHRIMSGARLRRAEPPVIRIEGLESGTSYTVQAAVLRREAFDYYANGRTIAERVLTTLEGQGSKWLANMRGGGQSAVGRAEATTTMGEPVFLRASVNGDVLTVTMNEALDGAQVPAASAFTVSGGHTVSGVAVSGSSLTLTLMPFVGADETVTVSYAVPGSGSKLQDDGGNAAPAFTDEAVANETPTVTLVLTPDTIGEDGETSTVTATLDKPSPQATTVTVTAPSSGAGYSLGANRELTIAANALTSTGVVTITAEDNDVDAPNKTVAVSGGAENSQGVSGPDDVTLTITDDDDAPTVTLVLTPASISEDGGVSMVTARLSHPSSEDTTLTVSVAPVSPAVAGDYTLTAVPLLSILAGETESESTNQVRITAVDNDVIAPDKTVTVSARVQNRQGVTAPQNVTLTITDDESAPPLPVLSIADASVDEGDTGSKTLDFTVTLDRAATETVTVEWATSDGTATAGTDYTAGNGTLTFSSGDSSKTVSVTVAGDNVDEPNETFTVTLSNPSGATLGDDTATGTITDDDDAPTVTLVLTPDTITESGGVSMSTVTATLNHPSSEATTVTVTAAPESPAVAGDYTLSGSQLTIPAGATASTGTVTITAVDNAVHAPDKTVTVSATATNAQGITTPQDVTLTILDDDNAAPTGEPTIDDTTPVVGETLTADASGIDDPDGLTDEIDLQWLRVASGGTATEITGATSETYTVVAADVGATLKVEASFTDDGGTEETVGSKETATVEAAPTLPALSIADARVNEGDTGSKTLGFTVTLDRAATETVTVEWATSDGTATAGTDYTAGNGTLTFSSGDSSKTVSVTVAGDNVDEPNETFTVTLTNPSGATLGDDTATGTITDDDATPTVTLVLTPDTITESGGVSMSTVTATLNHPSSESTTVTVTAAPESPAVASDYTLSGSQLTIPAGATASTGTVTITAVDNAVDAPHKTVTVSATATNAQGITAPQDVTLTILDDEAPPGLSVADASVDEGDSGSTTMTFTVTLNPVASGQVTVDWATADGTARAGTDYTAGSGSLTFSAGDSSKTVSVTVAGDDVDEPNETFTVTLSSASGADISDGTATGTITDDDDEPTVTLVLSSNSITEVNQQSTVTATLNHPSSEATTVTVSVSPVSPAVAGDYTLSTNRVLTIAAGATTSTGTVTVTSVNNTVDAPHKTVTVSATATNSLGVTAPDDVTLTIRDNDATPTVTLVLTPASIPEAGGTSTVTATLNHPSSEATTVTVSAAPVSPAGGGRLHAEREPGFDDCGGCDDEHGHGDDHGRGQRHGRGCQGSDGVGHGDEQPGCHGPAERDPDDHRRRGAGFVDR